MDGNNACVKERKKKYSHALFWDEMTILLEKYKESIIHKSLRHTKKKTVVLCMHLVWSKNVSTHFHCAPELKLSNH